MTNSAYLTRSPAAPRSYLAPPADTAASRDAVEVAGPDGADEQEAIGRAIAAVMRSSGCDRVAAAIQITTWANELGQPVTAVAATVTDHGLLPQRSASDTPGVDAELDPVESAVSILVRHGACSPQVAWTNLQSAAQHHHLDAVEVAAAIVDLDHNSAAARS